MARPGGKRCKKLNIVQGLHRGEAHGHRDHWTISSYQSSYCGRKDLLQCGSKEVGLLSEGKWFDRYLRAQKQESQVFLDDWNIVT